MTSDDEPPQDLDRSDLHSGAVGEQQELPSWEALFAARQFGAAYRAYRLARTMGVDDGLDPATGAVVTQSLAALADIEEHIRDRSFVKALDRLQRLDERADLVPWTALEADIKALEATGKLLDQRESEQALEALGQLDGSWFEAEVEAQRGTAHIYEGRFDEAKVSFEAALAVDPQHFRALTNLGNVALEEKRVDDAIDYYQRTIKLNDGFANAHHNLGVAYRRKGHLSKSVKSLKTAQRLAQRREASDARAKLGKLGSGPNTTKWLRWLLMAGAAFAVYYLFLRN